MSETIRTKNTAKFTAKKLVTENLSFVDYLQESVISS